MTQSSISRNFAFVADGYHRGAGVNKDKNVPDGSGNITFSVSLDFLYRQKAKMTEKNKSILLGVLQGETGLDPLKKRFNSYGLYGKKIQNNPAKFEDNEVTSIFLWGQNVTSFELNKIDKAIAALERKLGDASATYQTVGNSPKFEEALEQAKSMNLMIVAHYDDSFFSVNESDETQANLSLGYVKISTGRHPVVASFEHPTKDGLVETNWHGKKTKEYILDPDGSVSLSVTRSFLKNFGGTKYQNLTNRTNKSDPTQNFWTVKLASLKPDELPIDFVASFSKETQELFDSAQGISLNYVLSEHDGKIINDVTNITESGDALLIFTGAITDNIEDPKFIDIYTNDEGQKYINIKIRRGTFFTQRLLNK